jgi:fumarylacetoacetase
MAEAAGPFGPHNLSFGVVSGLGPRPVCVVRVDDRVIDLAALARTRRISQPPQLFEAETLNPYLAAGRATWTSTRQELQRLLAEVGAEDLPGGALADVRPLLPITVADYVDFYSSQHHAENVGRMFRPDSPALPPNWKHLPIGYHGRAGTIVVSGTDVVRPSGQRKPPDADAPIFGPSQRLDIEVEVGFVVGPPSRHGSPVRASAFEDHVFGIVLLNDWSARDIQAWEYQPLGPFLGKSFATSISPWVVPLAALDSARVPSPRQDPQPLPYLHTNGRWGLELALEVELNGTVVSRPPFSTMYWTPDQQLAHLTINGASLRTGDLYASGTVSGPERDQRGSFLELSWGGKEPFRLADGRERSFLEDGDQVTIRGSAPGPDATVVGLGEVTGRILPAH